MSVVDEMANGKRVLIAGSGPAGLSCALVLAEAGVPVTVLEALPELAHDLRAGTYHPPTLEMLAPYGITDRMIERGIKARTWQIRDREEGVLAEWDLGLLANDTPYPYRLHLEQHKLTPLMLDKLRTYPHFDIRFSAEVVGARETAGGVAVDIAGEGETETLEGAYVVGCEGIRSPVRVAMDVAFEGFTWDEAFVIVSTPYDFGPLGFANASYVADPEEWFFLIHVPGFEPPALWRIAMPADPTARRDETLAPAAIERRLQGIAAKPEPYQVVHANAYRVHQRVAASFNRGRMVVCGDAAHVNNPLGGMGLNGAVHDAINVGEKLVEIMRGKAGPELLDRYTRQRRPPQIEFVQRITINNKKLIEERDPAVRRTRHDELRRTAADPARAYAYLLESSMIAMVRRAAEIA